MLKCSKFKTYSKLYFIPNLATTRPLNLYEKQLNFNQNISSVDINLQ